MTNLNRYFNSSSCRSLNDFTRYTDITLTVPPGKEQCVNF